MGAKVHTVPSVQTVYEDSGHERRLVYSDMEQYGIHSLGQSKYIAYGEAAWWKGRFSLDDSSRGNDAYERLANIISLGKGVSRAITSDVCFLCPDPSTSERSLHHFLLLLFPLSNSCGHCTGSLLVVHLLIIDEEGGDKL